MRFFVFVVLLMFLTPMTLGLENREETFPKQFSNKVKSIPDRALEAATYPIKSSQKQKELYSEILSLLNKRHYRKLEIDDKFSREYLDAYLKLLDPQKSYFLQSDIDDFKKWEELLDDFLRDGNTDPGFIMYNRLRARVVDRLRANIDLLESEYEFDLTVDSYLNTNADTLAWLKSSDESDNLWNKRIKDSLIRLLLNDKNPDAARDLLIKRYENQLKQLRQRDSEDVFQLYANAFAGLYDPHTAYYSPRTTENFQINMSLSLEGIGAELLNEDDFTKVVRVIPGGPADMQGILKAEDKIIGVGQDQEPMIDVIGWRIDEVVRLIRGPKDSIVKLQILPANSEATKIVSIVRDKVRLEERSAQKDVLEILSDNQIFRIGVIEIPAFYMDFEAYKLRDPDYRSTSRDVFRLLRELSEEDIHGIILDLRNNSGGSLTEAIQLTDLFIETGPAVQIRDYRKRIAPVQKATRRSVYRGPLVVMINRLSASATEIFAGALQDYGRAFIVGSQSFGKGTVQDVTELTSGALKMTISKFYRVSGDSTQNLGVIPDIELPSEFDPEKIGESHKENALPWDRISAAPFSGTEHLKSMLEPLISQHRLRISEDADYAHMVAQFQLSKLWQTDDQISLSLDKRKARLQSWDDKVLDLENKRRKNHNLEPYADVQSWKEAEAIKLAESHIVESGDSLSEIARKYDVPLENLLKVNNLSNEDRIRVGEVIKIDKSVSPVENDPLLKETSYILVDQILLQHDLSMNLTSQNSESLQP